jgi:hypothetical protein
MIVNVGDLVRQSQIVKVGRQNIALADGLTGTDGPTSLCYVALREAIQIVVGRISEA